MKSLFGFETTAEKIAVKHYAASIEKGKEIIELYITKLKDEEGIQYVPSYSDTHSSDGNTDQLTSDLMTSDRLGSSEVDRDSVQDGLLGFKERTPLPSDELSMDYIDEDGRSGKSDRTGYSDRTENDRDYNSSSGKGSILNS